MTSATLSAMEPPTLPDQIAGETYLDETTFTGALADGDVLRGVEFDRCTFDGCVVAGSVLTDCTFSECHFTGCDLSRAVVTDSTFRDCTFADCVMMGVNFAAAHIGSLAASFQFERCRMDFTSFRGLSLTDCVWRDCRLTEADFGEADLRRVDFAGSDLSAADFSGADLRSASFVGAHNYVFDVRSVQIKGARLDVWGAARLLDVFGVEIVT